MRTVTAGLLLCWLTLSGVAADEPRVKDRFGDPLPEGAVQRLGTTRLRAPISSYGILADGTVVTVGPGNEVRNWGPKDDVSDFPILIPVPVPAAYSPQSQVSPDGHLIAANSLKKVLVWERPVGLIKQVAEFDVAKARYLLFSPDGTKLAVSYSTERAERMSLCDVKTGTVTELAGEGNSFETMAFSGDGKRLAAVTDYRVIVWDTTDGKKLSEYKTDRLRIRSVALDATGERMAAMPLSEPMVVHFLDTLTGKPIENLTGSKVGGGWVTFLPDGKTVLLGDKAGVRWWDPVVGKEIRKFEGVARPAGIDLSPARVTPDGKTLVLQNGSMLMRWDIATGKAVFTKEQEFGHAGSVNGLGVSPDAKRIVTRGLDYQVAVWDVATGKPLWKAPTLWSNDPQVVFSADGKSVFAAGPKWGSITKRDAATGRELELLTVDPKVSQQTTPHPIRLSPDGNTVFAITGPSRAGDPTLLTAWDTTTGEPTSSTRLVGLFRFDCELSPDARFLTGDRGAFAIENEKQNLLKDAKFNTLFHPGEFSADGRWFTIVGYEADDKKWQNQRAAIFDTPTWSRVATIDVPKNSRATLAPDGKTLAAAGDNVIAFYDVATSKEFARYKVPTNGWETERMAFTQAIRFTPDGTRLVTGHVNTTALVWTVPARPRK